MGVYLKSRLTGRSYIANYTELLKRQHVGDEVLLIHESNNGRDANAISVRTLDDCRLEYILPSFAQRLAADLDSGNYRFCAKISEINLQDHQIFVVVYSNVDFYEQPEKISQLATHEVFSEAEHQLFTITDLAAIAAITLPDFRTKVLAPIPPNNEYEDCFGMGYHLGQDQEWIHRNCDADRLFKHLVKKDLLEHKFQKLSLINLVFFCKRNIYNSGADGDGWFHDSFCKFETKRHHTMKLLEYLDYKIDDNYGEITIRKKNITDFLHISPQPDMLVDYKNLDAWYSTEGLYSRKNFWDTYNTIQYLTVPILLPPRAQTINIGRLVCKTYK